MLDALRIFPSHGSSGIKRVYITVETCMKFHQVKKAKGFASDNCTLQYLLNCNEKRCSNLQSYGRCSSPQRDCRPEFLCVVQPF